MVNSASSSTASSSGSCRGSGSCSCVKGLCSLALHLNSRISSEEVMQAVAGLKQLRHLQLVNVQGAFLRRPAVQDALASLTGLQRLGVSVDEKTWVWEMEKVPKQFRFLGELQELQELCLYTGLGANERHLKQALGLEEGGMGKKLVVLPQGCKVRLLTEKPEVYRLTCFEARACCKSNSEAASWTIQSAGVNTVAGTACWCRVCGIGVIASWHCHSCWGAVQGPTVNVPQ